MVRSLLNVMLFLAFFWITSSGQEAKKPTVITGNQIDVDVQGNITVLDTEHNMVRLYSNAGVLLREVGGRGWENDQFDRPSGIWAGNGIDIFVADYGNHRIQRFDRNLNYVSSFSSRDNADPGKRFGYPTGVALSRLGDLYICDGENSRIAKVSRFNQVDRTFGGFDAGKGRLNNPTGLYIGPGDFVFVVDGKRIVAFDSFGNYVHDFLSDVFVNLMALYATTDGITVLSDSILYCFDRNVRPLRVSPLKSFIETPGLVHSMALDAGKLYLLTDSGLTTVPSPCVREERKKLDKEK